METNVHSTWQRLHNNSKIETFRCWWNFEPPPNHCHYIIDLQARTYDPVAWNHNVFYSPHFPTPNNKWYTSWRHASAYLNFPAKTSFDCLCVLCTYAPSLSTRTVEREAKSQFSMIVYIHHIPKEKILSAPNILVGDIESWTYQSRKN